MKRVELFVPGRLCLFGEHSDWAGQYRTEDPAVEIGMCMVTGTNQGLYASACRAENVFELRQIIEDGEHTKLTCYPADPESLERVAKAGVFDSYAAGVACLLLKRFPGLGLRMEVHRRTLPLKKGLSSSAAVCVLTARAFNRVYGLGLSIEEEMEFAYRGEILTGSECGRMDQACAYGSDPVVLTFDGDRMGVRKLKPLKDVHLLIVDLKASKDTRRILCDLNRAFSSGDPGIRSALGSINHGILNSAGPALEGGDIRTLGELMTEAQSIFDGMIAPASPAQLEAPGLHAVLEHPAVRELAWGGKGVGSQGDGTAQLVCRDQKARRDLTAILMKDMNVSCIDLTINGIREPDSRPEK